MTKSKILYIVIAALVLVAIGGGLFFFLNNKRAQKEVGVEQSEAIFDCSGKSKDCFLDRMIKCTPVTVETTTASKIIFGVTIFGMENEICHLERKINNVVDLSCYFPYEVLLSKGMDLMAQIFGGDKGLQKEIDAACSKPK